MERLTKLDIYGHPYTNENINCRNLVSKDGVNYQFVKLKNGVNAYDGKPIDKLSKLEDLEEELDISLEVLFKALKGIIYFDDGTYSNDFHIENNGLSTWFFCNYDFKNTTKDVVYLKDYGKTWALTKEELE